MIAANPAVLGEALERLREVETLLGGTDAGICLIHLDACIASLESRIAKLNAAPDQDLQQVANAAKLLGRSISTNLHRGG